MGSVHRAVGICPGLALQVADVKLPRKDFLGHFSSCTVCPKLLRFAALHPFLGHPTAAPLHMHLQKLLPAAFSPPLPAVQIFSGPLAEGPWGLKSGEL